MMNKYNVNAFGLPNLNYPKQIFKVVPTYHSMNESKIDEYGEFPIPKYIDPKADELREVETVNGRISKLVYAVSYGQRDIFVVLVPSRGNYVMKTAWSFPKGEAKKLNLAKYKKIED